MKLNKKKNEGYGAEESVEGECRATLNFSHLSHIILAKMEEHTRSLQFYTLSGGLSTSSSSGVNSQYNNNLGEFREDWGVSKGIAACAPVALGNRGREEKA